MASSWSNFVNNHAGGIHTAECKCLRSDKKWETSKIKYKNCECFLEYKNFKDDLTEYKCLFKKNHQQKFDKKLRAQYFDTYKLRNHGNNKFMSLFQKSVYLYEYMDEKEKFSETSLPEKEDCYSELDMEDITDANYAPTERVWKDFEIKHLGEYYDLHVQSETLLLSDVFENFRNTYFKVYELDPARVFTAPGLAWNLLTDIDMLLMIEKGIREEYVTLFINMLKLIINTQKVMIKIKNFQILNIGM